MQTLNNIIKTPYEIATLLSKDEKLCRLLVDDSNEPQKLDRLPDLEYMLNNKYINITTPTGDGQLQDIGRNNYLVIFLDSLDFETEDSNISASIYIYVVSNISCLLINKVDNRLLEMTNRIYQVLNGQKLSSSGEIQLKTAFKIQIDDFNDAYRINCTLTDQQTRKVSI